VFNDFSFFSASVYHFERVEGPGNEGKIFDQGKRNLTIFVESPDFFHGSPDFPLPDFLHTLKGV